MMRSRVRGTESGRRKTVGQEQDRQAEPGEEDPDPDGVRVERHPTLRREPLRGVDVRLFQGPPTPLQGHGVRGR